MSGIHRWHPGVDISDLKNKASDEHQDINTDVLEAAGCVEQPGGRTAVVGRLEDGRELLGAHLGQKAEAGEGPSPAGHVERRVSVVVHQRGVTAGLQQPLDDLGLLGDHRQVQRRLRPKRGVVNGPF